MLKEAHGRGAEMWKALEVRLELAIQIDISILHACIVCILLDECMSSDSKSGSAETNQTAYSATIAL